MCQIYIRDSTKSDARFVNDLTRKVMHSYVEKTWPDEESRERYYAVNSFDQSTTKIICEDHQPIGRISLTKNNKEVIVDAIHLVPDVQGRGIGSKYFRKIIEDAKEQNKSVSLVVLKSNPAMKLYQRLGFSVFDETKERYCMRMERNES